VRTDRYGLPVSTASAGALDAYDRGVHALLGWGREALDLFQAATREDPGMAVAHAGAAVCLFLDERFGEARAAAQAARTAVAGQTTREREHVEALALFVTARPDEAEPPMRAYLETHPRDLVVAQRLYFVWFWQGRFPEMLALTERLLPAHGGNSFLLGLHAFALEEADRLVEAEQAAERAIAANPGDAWAVHALAHTLHEAARFDDGIDRLPPAIHPCTGLNWFRDHLLWHLALLHLGQGHLERADVLARRVFERAPSAIAGELHDSISLLWRLDLAGRPVGLRWRPFAEIARDRLNRQGLLFHAVHLAMALAAAGDWATAERQRGMLRERAAKDSTGLVGDVVLPLVEGMQAFPAGDYPRVIARLEPLRPRIVGIGGSRAQRAVFHDTLVAACLRAGDTERSRRLVAERAGTGLVPLRTP
jgi:tetratricopeptide (TPR) repeat protein